MLVMQQGDPKFYLRYLLVSSAPSANLLLLSLYYSYLTWEAHTPLNWPINNLLYNEVSTNLDNTVDFALSVITPSVKTIKPLRPDKWAVGWLFYTLGFITADQSIWLSYFCLNVLLLLIIPSTYLFNKSMYSLYKLILKRALYLKYTHIHNELVY